MVSVCVRSSYMSADGDVLEVDNIVVHENFDKYVYFNDIALIKVRTSVRCANIPRACVLLVYRVRTYAKVVTFIKLVAKKSRGVWRKVASYRTAGEGKRRTRGRSSLCRDWLGTNSGKYTWVTRAALALFLYFHNGTLERNRFLSFDEVSRCCDTCGTRELVVRSSACETLPREFVTPGERDFYNVDIFTGTRICKLFRDFPPTGWHPRATLFKVTSVPKSESLRNTVAKRSRAFVTPWHAPTGVTITRNVS